MAGSNKIVRTSGVGVSKPRDRTFLLRLAKYNQLEFVCQMEEHFLSLQEEDYADSQLQKMVIFYNLAQTHGIKVSQIMMDARLPYLVGALASNNLGKNVHRIINLAIAYSQNVRTKFDIDEVADALHSGFAQIESYISTKPNHQLTMRRAVKRAGSLVEFSVIAKSTLSARSLEALVRIYKATPRASIWFGNPEDPGHPLQEYVTDV